MSIRVTRTDISFQTIENRRMTESPIKPVDQSREASAVQITEKTPTHETGRKDIPVDRRKGEDRRQQDRRKQRQQVLLDTRGQQERRQKDRRQDKNLNTTYPSDEDDNKGKGIDVLA